MTYDTGSVRAVDDVQPLLHNRALIDPADPRYRQLLGDLQCNILSPHRKQRAHYFFLRFGEGDTAGLLDAKFLLGLLSLNALERVNLLSAVRDGTSILPPSLADMIGRRGGAPALADEQTLLLKDVTVGSELKAQRRNGGPEPAFATNILLTRHGCRKLGTPLRDAAFNQGAAARWERLNDPEPSYTVPASWDARYDDADAVLVVAYDPRFEDAGAQQRRTLELLRELLQSHTELLVEELGQVLRRRSDQRPIEAFGFRDGISQPTFFLPAGSDARAGSAYDDFAPLQLALTPDPYGRTPHACGSYFVFRKLRQDVTGFHRQIHAIAQALGRRPDDLLAETMGRRPSGQPLTAASSGDLNDFDFSDDRSALRCPGFAHIRKMNPRADVKAIYDATSRRIVRRGLTFGPELPRHPDGLPKLDAPRTDAPVGMLFYCAQADIAEQFEHLQAHWANNGHLPRALAPGPDAIVGRAAPRDPSRLAMRDRAGVLRHIEYQSHVQMRGGAYLFAPSISFLKSLLDDLWA